MNRLDKLLHGIDKKSSVLEIGPGYNPAVPKSQGWNSYCIDHGTKEELIEKFKNEPVDVLKIEQIDFVWKDGPLQNCVPEKYYGTFDNCVASHVIEHIPDFIRFFQSLEILLKPTGRISLAVPDRRFCFDCFRPLSTSGRCLDAYNTKRIRHTPGDKFEFLSYSAHINGNTSWGIGKNTGLALRFPFADARKAVDEHDNNSKASYIDCHAYQFTPSSFRLIILELSALGYINFEIENLFSTRGNEFIVILKRRSAFDLPEDQLQKQRLILLKEIQKELRWQSIYSLEMLVDWPYLGCAVAQRIFSRLVEMTMSFNRMDNSSRREKTLHYYHSFRDIARLLWRHFLHYPKLKIPWYAWALLKAQNVEAISFKVLKPPGNIQNRKVALFVTYHPKGKIKRHALYYMQCLYNAGYAIVLIKIVDDLMASDASVYPDFVEGCLVRRNHGFDIAAWAQSLKSFPQLYTSQILLFANDSVFGPLDEFKLTNILTRIENSTADVVCLTESLQTTRHFQSYFFALKNCSANHQIIHSFWDTVKSIPDKDWVISRYELTQMDHFLKAGCTCESIYPMQRLEKKGAGKPRLWFWFRRTVLMQRIATEDLPNSAINPTAHFWRELLESNYPFIKTPLLRGKAPEVSIEGWEDMVKSTSYDISMIYEIINEGRKTD
jgi:SAM-dependent methyltransferase